MANKEVSRVEIREVIRQWQTGRGIHEMSRSTGLSLNTIRKYVLTAQDCGLARNGPMLQGWWLEAGDDGPVIVVVHGSEGNRARPADRNPGIARELVAHGHDVLMFDIRRSSLPWFFIPVIRFIARNMYGVGFAAIKPEVAVGEIPVPLFIIL